MDAWILTVFAGSALVAASFVALFLVVGNGRCAPARKISAIVASIGGLLTLVGLLVIQRRKPAKTNPARLVPPPKDHEGEARRIIDVGKIKAEAAAVHIREADDDKLAEIAAARFNPDRPTNPK